MTYRVNTLFRHQSQLITLAAQLQCYNYMIWQWCNDNNDNDVHNDDGDNHKKINKDNGDDDDDHNDNDNTYLFHSSDYY